MTIDEAIEVLKDLDTTLPQFPPEKRREAVKLGLEALKGIVALRRGDIFYIDEPLSGETF